MNGKNEDKTFSRKTVTIYQIEIFEYKNLNKYKQGMEAYYKSVIDVYKRQASSRLLKKEYPKIREKLWKEAFWSQSFCPADSRRESGRSNPSRH